VGATIPLVARFGAFERLRRTLCCACESAIRQVCDHLAMNLRSARSAFKETWQTFHQSALKGSSEIVDQAHQVVAANDDDEAAVAQMRGVLSKHQRRAVKWASDRLGKSETRDGDRAYRIARAAAMFAPVKSIEPAREELFKRIAEMEMLPIGDAYQQLARTAPKLSAVVSTATPLPEDERGAQIWQLRQMRRLSSVVGPASGHPDALGRSSAAMRLVGDYMQIAAGDTSLGTLETTHREISRNRLKELEAREGYSVERLPGGRARVTARTTFDMRGSEPPSPT
jgi:hypothetical protein